ncbi:unnamed protein product [Urochloa humidicola]
MQRQWVKAKRKAENGVTARGIAYICRCCGFVIVGSGHLMSTLCKVGEKYLYSVKVLSVLRTCSSKPRNCSVGIHNLKQ